MIWGVIPAKDYARGKSRLAPVLTPDQRRRLARSLFLHVAGLTSTLVDRLAVLTDSAAVAADAHRLGALVLPDRRHGLGAVVDDGLAALAGDRALVLMADLPQASAAELRHLLARPTPAVVGDRHGLGTNALWTALPAGPSCFGNVDSLRRHLHAGFTRVDLPGLAWDVDEPEDLSMDESPRP